MKKLLIGSLIISSLLTFNALADQDVVTSSSADKICKEYKEGNRSLVMRKYNGKVISATGKTAVFYSDGNGIVPPFISLSISSVNGKNKIKVSGSKTTDPDDEDKYISLDGKTKTISVRINEIKFNSDLILKVNSCSIYGDLISD